MDFWGFNNYNFGMGMNNWFTPNYSFYTNPFFNSSSYFFNYQPPAFNFTSSFWNFTPTYSYTPVFQTYTPQNVTPASDNTKAEEIKLQTPKLGLSVTTPKIGLDTNISLSGYNASAGQRLANIALNNSVGWTGYCARHVKRAISAANLGSYEYGHAYQMPSILRKNKNFKEIPVGSVNVKDLPAGCILVYGKGKAGYSKDYGHTEITTGDGRAVSDGITKNLYKEPSAIFMPVERDYLA